MDEPDEVRPLYSIVQDLLKYEEVLRNLKEFSNDQLAKFIKGVNADPKAAREDYDKVLEALNKVLRPYDYLYNKSYIAEIPRILKRIGILLDERKEITDKFFRVINNNRISNLQTRVIEPLLADNVSFDRNTKLDPIFGYRVGQILTQHVPKTPKGGKNNQNYKKSRKSGKSRKGRKSRKNKK